MPWRWQAGRQKDAGSYATSLLGKKSGGSWGHVTRRAVRKLLAQHVAPRVKHINNCRYVKMREMFGSSGGPNSEEFKSPNPHHPHDCCASHIPAPAALQGGHPRTDEERLLSPGSNESTSWLLRPFSLLPAFRPLSSQRALPLPSWALASFLPPLALPASSLPSSPSEVQPASNREPRRY